MITETKSLDTKSILSDINIMIKYLEENSPFTAHEYLDMNKSIWHNYKILLGFMASDAEINMELSLEEE